MPGAADQFGQIQVPQTFSQYLNPLQTPPPSAMPEPTGFETHPHAVAGAEMALGFLQGVRRNRIQQAAQQDQNTETQLNAFRQSVNAQLSDPDLTEEGRQAILAKANSVMAQHMQYEMRDVPKDGVAGFFKNLLTHATGGPIKVREPIDFEKEIGGLTTLRSGVGQNNLSYSQSANFQSAVAQGTTALNAYQQAHPGVPLDAGTVRQILTSSGAYQKVALGAPSKANDFWISFGVAPGASYPERGSIEALIPLTAPTVPPTQAPPGSPPPQVTTPPMAGEAQQIGPPSGQAGPTGTPIPLGEPNQKAIASPAPPPVASAPASILPANLAPTPNGGTGPGEYAGALPEESTGVIKYAPGYGVAQFRALNGMSAKGGATISPAHEVITQNGVRTMAVQVKTYGDGNGYWTAEKDPKLIDEPVLAVSLSPGAHNVKRDPTTGRGYYWEPNLRKNVWEFGPDGKPIVIDEKLVAITDPKTGNSRWVPKSQAIGQLTQSMGFNDRKFAAQQILEQMRINATDYRTASQDLISLQSKAVQDKNAINNRYDGLVDAVKRGQFSILTSAAAGLNRPITPAMIQQAQSNPQFLVDEINQQRKDRLKEIDTDIGDTANIVREAFPEQRAGTTAAPPGSARPTSTNAPPAKPKDKPAIPIPSDDALDGMVAKKK